MSPEENNKKYVTFAVLPYLNLKKSITVGNVTFWPFYKECEKWIKDSAIRDHLKNIFSCYVSSCGTTLDHYLCLAENEKDELLTKLKELFRKLEVSAKIESILKEIPISPQHAIYTPDEEIACLEGFIKDPAYMSTIDRNKVNIAIEKIRNISVEIALPPILDPIESIAIASIEDKAYLEGVTADTWSVITEPIRMAVNTLFFACLEKSLWYQGRSHPSAGCTSDNFQVYYQNVKRDGDGDFFAISGGFCHKEINGVACDSTRITTPPHVPSHYSPDSEDALRQALVKVSNIDTLECRRIIRSISPLYQAFRNSSEDIDYNTRILLLAQAFEILLDLDEKHPRQDFRGKIDSILGISTEPRRCNYSIITRSKTIKENLTEKQIWAEEFYKLRNKIIHGEEVKPQDYQFTNINNISGGHFSIALQFFIISLEMLLEKVNIGYYCPHYFEVTTGKNGKEDDEEIYTSPFTINYNKRKNIKEIGEIYDKIF